MKFHQKVEQAKSLINQYIDKKIIVGSSFGKDSMVILHLSRLIRPDIPVFSVLSNTEFPETIKFIKQIIIRWKLNYKEYTFIQDKEMCCGKPKVEATKIALKEYDAWISGIRNTEGITRVNFKYVEERGGLIKLNPILEFTELDVWRYISLYKIPINPLYKKGYRSLGCSICTTPEEDERNPERAGRWKGTENVAGECGIHTCILR